MLIVCLYYINNVTRSLYGFMFGLCSMKSTNLENNSKLSLNIIMHNIQFSTTKKKQKVNLYGSSNDKLS